ncbi:MAG: hypothetical protein ABI165_14620 [Bryobacteraceae bacterium]
MKRLWIVILVLAPMCPAQPSEDRVALRDRMWMASKICATILQYFGHWQAVPDLNLDAAYGQYLNKISATDDRVAFDLATMELLGRLRNGHTDFGDRWLWKTHGQPLGFWLELSGNSRTTECGGSVLPVALMGAAAPCAPVDGKWIVRDASIEGLEAGEVVTAIDGRPTAEFAGERTKYIAASDDRARRAKVFFSGFLWPESLWKPRQETRVAPKIPDGVAYHRIFSEIRAKRSAA